MRGSGKAYRKRRNNERKVIVAILLFVIIIVGAGTALFFALFPDPIEPNMEIVSFRDYLGLSNDVYIIMDENVIHDYTPIVISGEIFLPVNFIMDFGFAGPHLWWDNDHQLLTITTQTELIRMEPSSEQMQLNRVSVPTIFNYYVENDMAYLPFSFLEERFDIISSLSDDNFLIVHDITIPITTANAFIEEPEYEEYIQLRHFPDIQSYVLENMVSGTSLFILEQIEFDDYEDYEIISSPTFDPSNFTRVMSESGAIGFIDNYYLLTGVENYTSGWTRQQELLPRNTFGEPIIIAWDNVQNVFANYTEARRTIHPGVNVMSPKWLRFEGSSPHSPLEVSSTLENISSRDYINWARNNGMQVWPLLFDYQNPRVASEILSQPNLRDHVINQLINISTEFDFDGIMIDIEGTNPSNQQYFLQFLRELAPIMRENDLIYSIAVFVPQWREWWYDHREIGRVVDYVAVMAYDENVVSVANAQEEATAGPNASINFVRRAVTDLLAVMDSQQIILGVPFYTRIWTITYDEEESRNRYAGRHIGIPFTNSYFANRDWYWSDHYGSYFVSYTSIVNGVEATVKAWLETERSLQLKANLVTEFDLAGVAVWERVLGSNSSWSILRDTVLQNNQ